MFSLNNNSNIKDFSPQKLPIKVCMHVLGIARTDGRVIREATALIEEGFAVCIVDIENEPTRPIEEDIDGICVKHIILPSWFSPSRFKLWHIIKALQVRILSLLRLLQTSADIYHAHDVMALPTCYIVARLYKKKILFDAHELNLPDWNRDSPHWYWIRVLLARLFVKILTNCSGIITVSNPIAQEIYNRYQVPKVTVIRNIPKYQIVSKSDRIHQYLGLRSDIRIALYQGNLQPDRGLDRLVLAAVHTEKDIVIVMMGKGVGTTISQLESIIAKERVADRVKIIPPAPYKGLLEWTASADIGLNILPPEYSLSIRMCLPNKLFEYLMAGLPVLTSSLDAVVEVINTYDVGQIVSSLEPADVGASINRMLGDPIALARMRRNALEAVQYDICWERESQILIQLYRDILGETQ